VTEKSAVIAAICRTLSESRPEDASRMLRRDYPFAPEPVVKRVHAPAESTRVFVRDGFRDRYSGHRLVFPGVLRVLSAVFPTEFPYHPNWKPDVTHPAYWTLGATIGHLVPVSRGGAEDESNWVTTSMTRNSAKLDWTLEELGWSLQPPGEMREWDGLVGWFMDYTAAHAESLANPAMRQWRRAAELALAAG
jgi:5-methylcytosine-specific restriction endonuclease McrA